MTVPGQLKNQQEAKGVGKYRPELPVGSGCQFSLAPAPATMKPMYCVRDGVKVGTYPVLFVGVIFPLGAAATIKDARTYYLLQLATAKLNGWFPIEHCFFDQADAEKEAARQRQAK